MNKRITYILSLTIILLSIVGFGIVESQNTPIPNSTNNDEFENKELAYLSLNDTSNLDSKNVSNLENISAINAEMLSLEDEVEVLLDNAETSYYHDKFVGRKTASGEIFSNKKYTAAHKTLPFGSKLRVTNNVNDESVIVTVNDRGPFTKGRHLDLSKQAFLDITHNKSRGTLNVKIEVLPDDYEESKIELEENLDEFLL